MQMNRPLISYPRPLTSNFTECRQSTQVRSYRYSEHVRWVPPRRIKGWEHGDTNPGLKIVAKNSSWEKDGIDPILVEKTNSQYFWFRVVDGHHHLNAAQSVNSDARFR